MARQKGKLRADRVIVLYSTEEFERLRQLFAQSTCRTYGAYIRKVSLQEPVQMIVRNGSFDAFVEEAVVLRNEMTAIREGGVFTPENQARLVRLQGEIQTCINKINDLCMRQ